jgi:hypothetical protein
MNRDEEYAFYADPDNQRPQGPSRRRRPKLSAQVPVRFPEEMVENSGIGPPPKIAP